MATHQLQKDRERCQICDSYDMRQLNNASEKSKAQ